MQQQHENCSLRTRWAGTKGATRWKVLTILSIPKWVTFPLETSRSHLCNDRTLIAVLLATPRRACVFSGSLYASINAVQWGRTLCSVATHLPTLTKFSTKPPAVPRPSEENRTAKSRPAVAIIGGICWPQYVPNVRPSVRSVSCQEHHQVSVPLRNNRWVAFLLSL